jgi:anti-sigma factor RsiW
LLRTPRLAGAFALAAALLIVVVLGVQSDNDRETGSMLLAEAPVDELRSFIDSNRPLDLASIDPSTAQRWLASRVEFSVPEAPRAAKTALTGARLCFFLGRRVAAYMYDREGQPVSLYIMTDTGLAMPTGISGNRPSHIAADGAEEFAHILWVRDGLLFSLVAPLPAERLMPLAQTLSASPREDGAGI